MLEHVLRTQTQEDDEADTARARCCGAQQQGMADEGARQHGAGDSSLALRRGESS